MNKHAKKLNHMTIEKEMEQKMCNDFFLGSNDNHYGNIHGSSNCGLRSCFYNTLHI